MEEFIAFISNIKIHMENVFHHINKMNNHWKIWTKEIERNIQVDNKYEK